MAYNTENSLGKGLVTQFRIVRALMVRDMMMRYGRDNLGFVWAVLEPMILTAGIMFITSVVHPTFEHGVGAAEFMMTGYMPLTLWRHMSARTSALFRRTAGLLYHRRITLFDILFATTALEFIATSTALAIVLGFVTAAGIVGPVRSVAPMLIGWLLLAWLAAGVGILTAVITEVSEVSERFIQPLQYLLLPISGIFFMVDWLPYDLRYYALLNPLTHCYEAFRGGFFGDEMTVHYEYWYPAVWAFGFTFFGIALVPFVRSRIRIA